MNLPTMNFQFNNKYIAFVSNYSDLDVCLNLNKTTLLLTLILR